MKTALAAVVAAALVMVVAMWFRDMSAASHNEQLQGIVQAEENGRRFASFRAILYEPNGGEAKAYAVLIYDDGRGHESHVGRYYKFKSEPGTEKWTVQETQDLWSESKGDKPPFMTPYWKMF